MQRCLTPHDALHVPGAEYILLSGSLEQARLVFKPLRDDLPDDGSYRFADSTTRMGIHHPATGTTLRVISSRAKSAFGLGANNPLAVFDEPGATDAIGGQLMNDALDTALGKPDSDMRVLYIGTLAPATDGWWHELVDTGTQGNTYVQAIKGDPEKWDQAAEIRRCNPLMWHYPESRKLLLQERDAARNDSRLRARFLSYRLNCPSQDESETLLTVADWQQVVAREPAEADGRPLVAVDCGGSRAWSAAVAIYPSGLIDAVAVSAGIPSVEAMEKRDRVSPSTYTKLVDLGLLRPAEGLRVPPVSLLWEVILEKWGKPTNIICDRFRLDDLKDATKGAVRIEPRVTRWSEAAGDIRSLRKCAKDGPFSVNPDARLLIEASLAVAKVKSDDQGNTRLVKRSSNNQSRDDIAAALTLGAGAFTRKPVRTGLRSLGLAG